MVSSDYRLTEDSLTGIAFETVTNGASSSEAAPSYNQSIALNGRFFRRLDEGAERIHNFDNNRAGGNIEFGLQVNKRATLITGYDYYHFDSLLFCAANGIFLPSRRAKRIMNFIPGLS